MFIVGIVIGLVLLLAFVLARSYFRVQEGHIVVLSRFGAALRDPAQPTRLRTFGPGLHRKAPWEQVHDVSVMEQNLELSGEDGGRTAMTEDGTMLRFDSILRYVPVEAELEQFLFGLRAPLEHITGLFTCLLRTEIANFRVDQGGGDGPAAAAERAGGSFALIRRERRELNRRIAEFCRARIGDRYGVRFNAVDLADILPPDELATALNAVINAHTEAETQLARAEADCQMRVLASQRGVEIARARAAAVETEILRLADYLDELDRSGTLDLYVRRRRNEALSESRALFIKQSA